MILHIIRLSVAKLHVHAVRETGADQQGGTVPCIQKLSVCGVFSITTIASFRLVNHRANKDDILTYAVYSGGGAILNGTATRNGVGNAGSQNTSFSVQFHLEDLGVHVLAIYLNAQQVQTAFLYTSSVPCAKIVILCRTRKLSFAESELNQLQVPNSPFLFAVSQTVCGMGRVPDSSGMCFCPAGTAAVTFDGTCASAGIIATVVILSGTLLAVAVFILNRHIRGPAEEDDIRRAVRSLRQRLHLTRQEGFLLSSDRLPPWRRADSIVFVQRTCLVSPLQHNPNFSL